MNYQKKISEKSKAKRKLRSKISNYFLSNKRKQELKEKQQNLEKIRNPWRPISSKNYPFQKVSVPLSKEEKKLGYRSLLRSPSYLNPQTWRPVTPYLRQITKNRGCQSAVPGLRNKKFPEPPNIKVRHHLGYINRTKNGPSKYPKRKFYSTCMAEIGEKKKKKKRNQTARPGVRNHNKSLRGSLRPNSAMVGLTSYE